MVGSETLDLIARLLPHLHQMVLLLGAHFLELPATSAAASRLQPPPARSAAIACVLVPPSDDAVSQTEPSITAEHTHTHAHTNYTGTIRVSRYQKGKTNLDFTEAIDSE